MHLYPCVSNRGKSSQSLSIQSVGLPHLLHHNFIDEEYSGQPHTPFFFTFYLIICYHIVYFIVMLVKHTQATGIQFMQNTHTKKYTQHSKHALRLYVFAAYVSWVWEIPVQMSTSLAYQAQCPLIFDPIGDSFPIEFTIPIPISGLPRLSRRIYHLLLQQPTAELHNC